MWEDLIVKLLPVVLPYLSSVPAVTTAISDVVGSLKTTTAPTTAAPSTAVVKVGPSTFVKNGQHLINTYLKPVPPLTEDGYLGPKTEAVIRNALAPYGIVL